MRFLTNNSKPKDINKVPAGSGTSVDHPPASSEPNVTSSDAIALTAPKIDRQSYTRKSFSY
jgi:hypothetical protein